MEQNIFCFFLYIENPIILIVNMITLILSSTLIIGIFRIFKRAQYLKYLKCYNYIKYVIEITGSYEHKDNVILRGNIFYIKNRKGNCFIFSYMISI
jgi:hypothetical protein